MYGLYSVSRTTLYNSWIVGLKPGTQADVCMALKKLTALDPPNNKNGVLLYYSTISNEQVPLERANTDLV